MASYLSQLRASGRLFLHHRTFLSLFLSFAVIDALVLVHVLDPALTMVKLTLVSPKGNHGVRFFPSTGYLGLTPLKFEGRPCLSLLVHIIH